MKRVVASVIVCVAVMATVSAQLRSFNSGIAGREEKSGSGRIQSDGGDLRLRRVFLRFDNNSDVFIRMYPEANARTYSGRYYWEGNNRIHISLTQGTGHMSGYVEMHRSGNSLTFGKIRFSGETANGSRQSVSFDPDRATRPGSERDTPVEEWNAQWGSGSGGGWGSVPSFDGSSAGSGRATWGGNSRSLSRAALRVRNSNDAQLNLTSGDSIAMSGDGVRRNGDTYTFNIRRFEGRSATGRATVVVRGREVQSVTYSGRANNRSFNGNFRRF